MKARLLFCLLTAFTLCANAQGAWNLRDSITGPGRYGAASFSVGNYGYVVAGYHTTALLNDCWQYDPVTDTWSQQANFPGGMRWNCNGFSIGSFGYVSCGFSSVQNYTMFNDLWRYDPSTNSWLQRASLPASGRWMAAAFATGGKGYLGTGSSGTAYLQDFWEYDPSNNTWTQKQNFPYPITLASSFDLNLKGYVLCGNDTTTVGISPSQNEIWEYDPALDSWTQKSNLPGSNRAGASTFTIGSLGYVTLGRGTGYPVDSWSYDPSTDTWSPVASFPSMGRWMTASFSIGNAGYITTGRRQTKIVTQETWKFGIDINGFETAGQDQSAMTAFMSGGQFFITNFPGTNIEPVVVKLYDAQGKLVSASGTVVLSAGMNTIDIGQPAMGIYFCVIENSSGPVCRAIRICVTSH
ncbi:MAG TPA: kelch repeat-containing protein [Bacteroidia bacterium]|nr:kelch repeat-containing protein [Bacteroidia bacterium]